jgi:nitrilase
MCSWYLIEFYKMSNSLTIGMAQIAPVWLQKNETLIKIKDTIVEAAHGRAELVVFGEAVLPGYPFWISLTNGAAFDSMVQKELYAHYIENAAVIENGDLEEICKLAKQLKTAVYLGIVEKAKDRGGHSLYCSLVYINQKGNIKSVHRKLQPTYEERLTWAPGDGNGLRVHKLKNFTLGGLNCWENWMPLPRAALYAQGENVHIAVWPGRECNTKDITRFIARESRSYVISVSSLMRVTDIPKAIPHEDLIIKKATDILANGGSCIAGPDGEWVVPPVLGREGVILKTIEINKVYEERQNFDPSGHYSRPDVTNLSVNRARQRIVSFTDE